MNWNVTPAGLGPTPGIGAKRPLDSTPAGTELPGGSGAERPNKRQRSESPGGLTSRNQGGEMTASNAMPPRAKTSFPQLRQGASNTPALPSAQFLSRDGNTPVGDPIAGGAHPAHGQLEQPALHSAPEVTETALALTGPTTGDTAATEKPAAGTPAAGTPVTGTPVTGTPVTGTPVTGTPVTGTPAAHHTEGAMPSATPIKAEAASGGEGANALAAAQSRTEESMRVNEQLAALQQKAATAAALLKLQESLNEVMNSSIKSIGSATRSASQ